MSGYIKLHRKSIDSGLMQDHKTWTFWCWCLLNASWQTRKESVRDVLVELKPGEFIMGRKSAAKKLNMSEQSIRTCVAKLEKYGNITTRSTNRFTVISIVNWNTYQQCDGNNQPAEPLEDEVIETPAGMPQCPHAKIVELYHDILPELPKVKVWSGTRKSALKARWREDKKRQNLEYWEKFFRYVRESDFLMGKSRGRGDRPFIASLEWLTRHKNFIKVIEGFYH